MVSVPEDFLDPEYPVTLFQLIERRAFRFRRRRVIRVEFFFLLALECDSFPKGFLRETYIFSEVLDRVRSTIQRSARVRVFLAGWL